MADLDGDGKISTGSNKLGDTGDRVILGNSTPRFNYGLTIDASWKGIDFRAFFQGIGKRDYWLQGPYFWGSTVLDNGRLPASRNIGTSGVRKVTLWGANTNAYYPRVARNGGKNTNVQSRYLQNAAYCRLKNIQIGYTLPKTWTEKAGMSSVRVYVSGDNLLTFSDITGIFDPEAIGSTYDANNGKLYPLQRVISVGLNVNF